MTLQFMHAIEAVMIRLESDLHRMLDWFTDNGIKSILQNFKLYFCDKKTWVDYALIMTGY